jgi:hypothetical protein
VRRALALVTLAVAGFLAGFAGCGSNSSPTPHSNPAGSIPPPQPSNPATNTGAHETETRPTPTQ